MVNENDSEDDDGSRYLNVNELSERDTYYIPRVQFQTTECGSGKYLCLECLNLRDYYLAAGFPANNKKYTVKMQHSTYPEGDNRFYWKIMCESDSLEKCKFVPIRFEGDGHLMITDDWGGSGYNGGSYDATLGYEEGNKAYFRVHAPNPTDGQNQIYENTNAGSTEQLVKYSTKVGVSQTEQTSSTVTSTVSTEIGASFKAFSSSVSSEISNSWTTTDSSIYEAAKTVEHDITIPARCRIVLKQLKGNYDGEFSVGDDSYTIEEHPLDSGASRSYTIRFEKGKAIKKDEL